MARPRQPRDDPPERDPATGAAAGNQDDLISVPEFRTPGDSAVERSGRAPAPEPAAGSTGPATSPATPPATAPTRPGPVPRTRTGNTFTGLIIGAIILILLLVFILENTKSVKVSFFGAGFHAPLGVAMLIAAVAGALIVGFVGGARIIQLRRRARRPRV